MAINFNNSVINGIFNQSTLSFTNVKGSGNTVSVETTLTECKDPLFIMVDLKQAFISMALNQLSIDGKIAASVNLVPGEMNIIPVTTFGCVDKDGKITFEFMGMNDATLSDVNIGVCAFTHIPVINH